MQKYPFSILLFALLLLFVNPLFRSSASVDLDSDPHLQLHLDFDQPIVDNRVLDVSGHGHDGVLMNPTNWITFTNGAFGTTAGQWTSNFQQFDYSGHIYPASQYLAVTNVVNMEYLTNATISFWAKFDTNGDLGMQIFDASYSPGNAQGGYSAATNSWFIGRLFRVYTSFCVYGEDGSARQVVDWPVDVVRWGGNTPDLSTTNLHLYSVTLDCPAHIAIAYYDGVPVQTNLVEFPWIRMYGYPKPWLSIGANAHDGTYVWGDDLYPNSSYFMGRMDDIRIYDRTLRSEEILSLSRDVFVQNITLDAKAGQSVKLFWDSTPNALYQVEAISYLSTGTWIPISEPFRGSTGISNIVEPESTDGVRFYRVRVLPQF